MQVGSLEVKGCGYVSTAVHILEPPEQEHLSLLVAAVVGELEPPCHCDRSGHLLVRFYRAADRLYT